MPDYSHLAQWLEQGAPDSRGLGAVKEAMFARGVNSRGWRLYADHGDVLFAPLRTHWLEHSTNQSAAVAASWLRLLQACEMDVLPPPALVRNIADWKLPGEQLDAISPLFLRAAWKACINAQYLDEDVSGFVEGELTPLAQWFFASGTYKVVSDGRLKAGWESLKRLRLESVAIESRKLGTDDWPPVVRKFESGGYRMVALCNETDLKLEGDAMYHCVGGYADTCRFEPLQIFSVQYKKTSTRVATLSLREKKPGVWEIDQLKGPLNAAVDKSVWREVFGLLQVVDQVSREDVRLREFLDFIHSLGRQPNPDF
jgi:hypothetical protein